jgi:hypothetical protein
MCITDRLTDMGKRVEVMLGERVATHHRITEKTMRIFASLEKQSLLVDSAVLPGDTVQLYYVGWCGLTDGCSHMFKDGQKFLPGPRSKVQNYRNLHRSYHPRKMQAKKRFPQKGT